MTTRQRLMPMITGAAMAATVFGATLGVAPASAAPGQTSATLFIIQDPQNAGNYRIAVVGRFPMLQADAVGFLNNINNGDCEGRMLYYIYGDDPGEVDPLLHHNVVPGAPDDAQGYLKASSQGLEFRRDLALRKNFLDEERGAG
ncbi:hypothetical protein [Mycolicibacterium thermoresistibile]